MVLCVRHWESERDRAHADSKLLIAVKMAQLERVGLKIGDSARYLLAMFSWNCGVAGRTGRHGDRRGGGRIQRMQRMQRETHWCIDQIGTKRTAVCRLHANYTDYHPAEYSYVRDVRAETLRSAVGRGH